MRYIRRSVKSKSSREVRQRLKDRYIERIQHLDSSKREELKQALRSFMLSIGLTNSKLSHKTKPKKTTVTERVNELVDELETAGNNNSEPARGRRQRGRLTARGQGARGRGKAQPILQCKYCKTVYPRGYVKRHENICPVRLGTGARRS